MKLNNNSVNVTATAAIKVHYDRQVHLHHFSIVIRLLGITKKK